MATTYNVYRDGIKIKSGLTIPEYTDTNLVSNKKYSYQVSAQNEIGESALSVAVDFTIIPVTGVSLDKTTLTVKKGTPQTLTATVSPTTATDKTVSWTSSNTAVATVDNAGKVTALKSGSCIITVKTTDGNKTDVCNVTAEVPVTGVSLNKTTLTLSDIESETLVATVLPADATNKSATWTSSDVSVATVDNTGLVTAIQEGACTITVKTVDGNKTATCQLTVLATMKLIINDVEYAENYAALALDEDEYDDLTTKDSKTIYKVYQEGGNPDEGAWFLGSVPIDKAMKDDKAIYGRNLVTGIKENWSPRGNLTTVSVEGNVLIANIFEPNSYAGIITTGTPNLYEKFSVRYEYQPPIDKPGLFVRPQKGSVGSPIPQKREENGWQIVSGTMTDNTTNSVPTYLYVTESINAEFKVRNIKFEPLDSITPFTIAPEDVAIIPEHTRGDLS